MCGSKLLGWMFPLISILIAVSQVEASNAKYTITDLGKDVTPTAINNHGQVVGFVTGADIHRQAIVYDRGRIRHLGTFGGSDSMANGINDKGHIVGNYTTNGDTHGFALFHHGRFVDLFSAAAMVDATGINIYDAVLGETEGTLPYGTYRIPVLFDHGAVTDLGKGAVGRSIASSARGLNNLGQAIFFQSVCSDCVTTILFSKNDFTWFHYFTGYDINDREQLAGYGGSFVRKACVVEKGAIVRVNDLGGYHSLAYSINNLGQTVGVSQTTRFPSDLHYYPFIAFKGTVTELGTLLPSGTKWTFSDLSGLTWPDYRQGIGPTAINDRGQIIGNARFRGEKHGFLLTPIAQPVEADVIPKIPDNDVKLQPNGHLQVAVFGSPVFNAASIRPTSLRLTAEAIGLKGRVDRHLWAIKDINGDGRLDFTAVIFIDEVRTPPQGSAHLLMLEGASYGGNRIEGTVSVRQM